MAELKADLLLIDGKHAMWRAADAFHDLSIPTEDGDLPTGAIFGFLSIVLRAQRTFGGIVVVAWDDWNHGPAARRRIFTLYKARKAQRDDDQHELLMSSMRHQQALLMELLKLAGIRQAHSPEWEADDVIASLCTSVASRPGTFPSLGEMVSPTFVGILSGDRDLLQLVSDTTTLIRPAKGGEFKLETPATIRAEHGIEPCQVLDMKALAGDPGDNIPGVHGIGLKTAAKLIQRHGTWRRVVEWASQEQQLPSRLGGLRNQAIVEMSAELARLRPDCPLIWIKPDYNRRAFTAEMLRYKFRSLLIDGKLDGLLALGGS